MKKMKKTRKKKERIELIKMETKTYYWQIKKE